MAALLGQSCITEKAEQATGFIRKTMDIDGEARGYVVYVPDGYSPSHSVNWSV